MHHRSLLLLLLVPGTALAEDALTFRGALGWLNVYQHTTPLASDVNPGNQALQIPSDELVSELRPNLKFSTDQLQLLVRPRVEASWEQVKVNGKSEPGAGKATSWLNEGFLNWTLNETTSFSYGIQSYQWGPTEVLSPSNRIFHTPVTVRDILFEVEGKQLARVNFSSGKHYSAIVMADVKDVTKETNATPFQAGIPWSSSALVKPEFSWKEGEDYVGLVLGAREKGHGWIGEYLNYNLPFFDGLTVFGDASQERGSAAWYPTADQAGLVTFAQTKVDQSQVYTLADVGMKFDFVNGTILRGEYVLNQAGYDKNTHDLAMAAFQSRNPAEMALRAENTERFLEPGLELPGQRYAYASLHVPDFVVQDLTVELRSLVSLRDASSYNYAEVDYKVGDSGTISYAETVTGGRRDSELRGYASPTHFFAYRHDW